MSFRQWDKEHGRRVKKGERAIWIPIVMPTLRSHARLTERDSGPSPLLAIVRRAERFEYPFRTE